MARECDCPGVLRRGAIMAREKFAWADPDFFQINPVPVLYGDLATALSRPDGMVVTLAMARKYFGTDNVVGQTLEIDHAHVMTIRAVIADFPPNASTSQDTVFASSLAPFSWMSEEADKPGMSPGSTRVDMTGTLVRLRPGASLDDLNRRAAALMGRFAPRSTSSRSSMHFERTDALNMSENLHPGARTQLLVKEAVALVILVLSCVNFVSLSVARSAQRGLEVTIRKVVGAARCALIVQFLGEAILQVLFALCLAIVLVEWSLPAVRAFLESGAVFDYWRSPVLFFAMLAGALVVGVTAGAYPALILSALRPAIVLKGQLYNSESGAWLRWALVALQFTALIVFLIAAATIFRQNRYATSEALRVATDQTLIIRTGRCPPGLKDGIAALPGVRGTACSSTFALGLGIGEDAFFAGRRPHSRGCRHACGFRLFRTLWPEAARRAFLPSRKRRRGCWHDIRRASGALYRQRSRRPALGICVCRRGGWPALEIQARRGRYGVATAPGTTWHKPVQRHHCRRGQGFFLCPGNSRRHGGYQVPFRPRLIPSVRPLPALPRLTLDHACQAERAGHSAYPGGDRCGMEEKRGARSDRSPIPGRLCPRSGSHDFETGRGLCRLRRHRHAAVLPGTDRNRRLHRRAPHQKRNRRPTQGDGRTRPGHTEAALVAVRQAGAEGQSHRVATGLVVDEPMAIGFCLSCGFERTGCSPAAGLAALLIALATVASHAILVARQKPVLALRYE